MLLRFSVSNFLSIRDRQELSMVASKLKGNTSGLIHDSELRHDHILPSAIIYGPNGSGKSNIIASLNFMCWFVRNSQRRGEPGEPIDLSTFALAQEYEEKSSKFSIDFIHGGSLYLYSFELIRSGVLKEALYLVRQGRRSMLYERKSQEFAFGRILKGPNKTIESITRNNSLFLSAAAQNNHPELTSVFEYFKGIRIHFGMDEAISPSRFDHNLLNRIASLLNSIETGITEIKIEEGPPPDEKALEFREALISVFEKTLEKEAPKNVSELRRSLEERSIVLKFGHKKGENETTWFDLRDESAGISQLLSILTPILLVIDSGGTVVIDEFGSRLHTRASEVLISLFNSRDTNRHGSQILVATHDTNLLSLRGMRRDQIWFTEKDHMGATHLYPLTDFEIRPGDNFEKGYLQGRFGAIPFAGSIAGLLKAS
jgi:AAA15 family ATPase/GTPase